MSSINRRETDSNLVRKTFEWSKKHINYKVGSIAGLIAGSIVYYINRNHGVLESLEGASRQFVYNLFIGGFNTKVCEKLAKNIVGKARAIAAATVVPTAQAFLITYGVHKFGGTPEALNSSAWQIGPNLIGCYIFGRVYYAKRNKEI